MSDIISLKSRIQKNLYILYGTILLILGGVLCQFNHYFASLILVVGAVALYFYVVYRVSGRNWLDIRAVFTGAWIFTIGLAPLRLLNYQENWQFRTWLYCALAYFFFQFGTVLGQDLWKKVYQVITKIKCKKIRMKLEETRLFWICLIVSCLGCLCFVANILIRGYVPFFSSDPAAYITFHTKFNLFAMASTMISGLCYYCIKTQKISLWKKILLFICILYETFLYPTLIVSRGIFLTSALTLVTTIFYLHKKKFRVLILSLVLVLGTYLILSNARGYSNEQLDIFFEPSTIYDEDDEDGSSFTLPSKVAFFYCYLTVSHDNFNEAVQNAKEYTYGLRQLEPINLKPFNLLFDFSAIDEAVNEGEYYQVRPHLNTVNLIGNFYYDLRGFGIAAFMMLWGCVFMAVQAYYMEKKGPFGLLSLGNLITPVALCFFSSWMNQLQFWVLWGAGWILGFVACLHIQQKDE